MVSPELLDPGSTRERCNEALERLGIPEAGLKILVDASVYDRPKSKPADFEISPELRERLKKLLGKDAGSRYLAWQAAVGEAIDHQPSTLPEAVQKEVDRESKCYVRYINAFTQWYEARGLLFSAATAPLKVPKPDYDAATVDAFEREIDIYVNRVDAVIRKWFPAAGATTEPASTSRPKTQRTPQPSTS